ncbi:MAG TPA: hypothetical protein P5548_00060 [Candidatus Moranbacteria bacterium]|nr:hypothetical protein [Candidatus Moranbacteria bacterium]HRZ33286.1 hypothetical protein [Candidatus Moranbacteria bacterium]
MKNKKGNVAVIAIIIVIVVITAGIVGYLFAKKTQAPVAQPVATQPVAKSSVELAVGNSCDNSNKNNPNPDGLQCYFYDSKDASGKEVNPRKGVWIKPNIASALVDAKEYEKYLKEWRKYESSDKIISFNYPQNWKIYKNNLDDISIFIDSENSINISKIEKNSVTMEDRINDEKKNKTVLQSNITLGSDGIKLDVASVDNISGIEGYQEFFFQKNGYHIEIIAPKFGIAEYDFPINYLLSTIKIK